MNIQVGKCYVLTSDGKEKRFSVIKNVSNREYYIRDCDTDIEEEFITETNKGGFSQDVTLKEIDCKDCDGTETLPPI
ncbi:MAG: hypothetical protein CMH30_05740 [Micavibrio sp.]|nr:hypothetical protein [Micavibrio sp.]|tara:strand:+ start:5362 stop:5592 length:231 start_codon:yes stop_codon:yes gene_type:complete